MFCQKHEKLFTMKNLKLTALVLIALLTAASAFTAARFTIYWFDPDGIYTGRYKTSANEVLYLHDNGYSGITLNTTASGGTLIEKGYTALGPNQTPAGINEENIYGH